MTKVKLVLSVASLLAVAVVLSLFYYIYPQMHLLNQKTLPILIMLVVISLAASLAMKYEHLFYKNKYYLRFVDAVKGLSGFCSNFRPRGSMMKYLGDLFLVIFLALLSQHLMSFAWSLLLFTLSLLLMLLFTISKIRENKKDIRCLEYEWSLTGFFLCKILLYIVIATTIFECFGEYLVNIISLKYRNVDTTIIIGALIAILYLLLNCCSNFYANHIDKKILRLYDKPDGEYVIISNSAWLFWLPVLCAKVGTIIGRGMKAKKNGDYIEVSGISARYLPEPYRFNFEFCKYSEDHGGFGKTEVPFSKKDKWRDYPHSPGRVAKIIFMIFTYDNGIWRFRIIDHLYPLLCNEKFDTEAYDNYDSRKYSHNYLMGIYFGSINHYYEEYNIIYRIITQTGKNKVIKKDMDEDRIIEYYHYNEQKYNSSSILKITKAKDGYYYYIYGAWDSVLRRFSIKEFMQLKGINPRGLFAYGNEDDGAIVYCLNGNYFKCSWERYDRPADSFGFGSCDKSTCVEPITQEKYLEILEYDNKYYREKESREERWRNIVYNIITQMNENEIIYKDEKNHYEYYYKEEHPGWSGMNVSIYKCNPSEYHISGSECTKVIKEFMKLNFIHPDDLNFKYPDDLKYPDYPDGKELNLNNLDGKCVGKIVYYSDTSLTFQLNHG